MFHLIREFASRQSDRLRDHRLIGVALALLAEVLLVLVVLSMALVDQKPPRQATPLVSVTVTREAEGEKKRPEPEKPRQTKALQPPRQTQTQTLPVPTPPASQVPSPAIIPLSGSAIPALQVQPAPARPQVAPAPGRSMMGPPDTGVPGDSKRVGTAPGGEPMYAAAWYREPYDDELRGFLSTASGPGWALITCRTAPNYRVEDCVGLGEYPENSNLQRAVLAAAWQFLVRPPRVGGVSRVGEWVRIRIEYGRR